MANWLSASLSPTAISAAAGSTLTVNANSSSLTAGGSYQGTVTVTPVASARHSAITVNFTVAPAAAVVRWTVSPSTLAWSYTTNSIFSRVS